MPVVTVFKISVNILTVAKSSLNIYGHDAICVFSVASKGWNKCICIVLTDFYFFHYYLQDVTVSIWQKMFNKISWTAGPPLDISIFCTNDLKSEYEINTNQVPNQRNADFEVRGAHSSRTTYMKDEI